MDNSLLTVLLLLEAGDLVIAKEGEYKVTLIRPDGRAVTSSEVKLYDSLRATLYEVTL